MLGMPCALCGLPKDLMVGIYCCDCNWKVNVRRHELALLKDKQSAIRHLERCHKLILVEETPS